MISSNTYNEFTSWKECDPDEGGQVHRILLPHHCCPLRDPRSNCDLLSEEESTIGEDDREDPWASVLADHWKHDRDQCGPRWYVIKDLGANDLLVFAQKIITFLPRQKKLPKMFQLLVLQLLLNQ